MLNDKGELCIQRYHDLGNSGGAALKDALVESGGYMLNDKGELCIQGYYDLGNLSKDALIKSGGHMNNEHGVRCIKGYNDLGHVSKDARIKSGGYILNDKCKWCIKGYNDMGNSRKDAIIESGAHMVNDKGESCIRGYHDLGNLGNAALQKILEANALGEHHTHICISAICQRGASVKWEHGYAILVHHCYDPQQSGLAGQKPRQKKGQKWHMCKKCHRPAKECKGGVGCLAPACSNTSLKSCQHLH